MKERKEKKTQKKRGEEKSKSDEEVWKKIRKRGGKRK